jgi:hypothetical protein
VLGALAAVFIRSVAESVSRSQHKLTSFGKPALEVKVKQRSQKPVNTPKDNYPQLSNNYYYDIYQDVLDGTHFPLVQVRTSLFYDEKRVRLRRKGHARMRPGL